MGAEIIDPFLPRPRREIRWLVSDLMNKPRGTVVKERGNVAGSMVGMGGGRGGKVGLIVFHTTAASLSLLARQPIACQRFSFSSSPSLSDEGRFAR